MNYSIKKVIKYIIPILISVVLLFYAFQGIHLEQVANQFKRANYFWIFISVCCAILSHLSRAYRWKLLLAPLGYNPSLFKSFLAVMISYFMNLIIPRAGEVTRCGVIQKLEDVPASTAFGTVVLERVIDLSVLLSMMIILLIVEFNRLNQYFLAFLGTKLNIISSLVYIGIAGLFFIGIGLFLFFKYRSQIIKLPLFKKLQGIFQNILRGILSIKSVRKKPAFIFHTLFIWLMYYMMSYTMFFCFPETSHLSVWFGFILLIMGAIGMATPVQGGVGAYHLLVGSVFTLEGLSNEEGIVMATFIHTVQTVNILFVGGLAFLVSILLINQSLRLQSKSDKISK